MVRRPNANVSLALPDSFDDGERYRIKLNEIEERESQYGNGTALVWHSNIYDRDGIAFQDTNTGLNFDLWMWTSDSTAFNPANGRKAKAREYAEAFLGRALSDDDINEMIDDGFAEALVGHIAIASFEVTTNADGNSRLNVIKLRPAKGNQKRDEKDVTTRKRKADDDDDDDGGLDDSI